MPTLDEALQELAAKLGATLSLVVAWASDDGFEAGDVRMSEAASGQLRDLAIGFAQDLQDSETVTYTGDAELEGDEVFLITDEAVLAELEPILALGENAVAHADVEANQLDPLHLIRYQGTVVRLVRKMLPFYQGCESFP